MRQDHSKKAKKKEQKVSGHLGLSVGQATKGYVAGPYSLDCRHLIYKREETAIVVASDLHYLCNSLSTLKLNKASKYSTEFFGITKVLRNFTGSM